MELYVLLPLGWFGFCVFGIGVFVIDMIFFCFLLDWFIVVIVKWYCVLFVRFVICVESDFVVRCGVIFVIVVNGDVDI